MGFWVAVGDDRCIALIPKAGLQSMQAVLRNIKEVTPEQARDYPLRIAFVREPLTRFGSCYSFFYWLDKDDADGPPNAPRGDDVASYEAFVDWTFKHSNVHWNPQLSILKHDGEMIPNRLHRFEDVDKHWERYFGPGWLPHKNAVTRLPTNNYRLDEIRERYREDAELWLSL